MSAPSVGFAESMFLPLWPRGFGTEVGFLEKREVLRPHLSMCLAEDRPIKRRLPLQGTAGPPRPRTSKLTRPHASDSSEQPCSSIPSLSAPRGVASGGGRATSQYRCPPPPVGNQGTMGKV